MDEDTSPTPPSATELAVPQETPVTATEPETVPIETPPATEPQTAHSAPNEPFAPQSEPIPPPSEPNVALPTAPASQNIRDLRERALLKKQELKRKKLDKIMEVLNTKTSVTNDEVEKLLHVSDATATRYLSALEKDGKIKQVGKTGAGVVYTKI